MTKIEVVPQTNTILEVAAQTIVVAGVGQQGVSGSLSPEGLAAAQTAVNAAAQAAASAASIGTLNVLHPVELAIPPGWWDTGWRQSATSALWSGTSTFAIISNWSAAALYMGGQATAFFDFTTASRMFQDQIGTAVTAAGQSVAVVRDSVTSPLSFGPELVTNGGFDTDAAWVRGARWTISGGQAQCAPSVTGTLSQPISLTAGRTYLITGSATISAGNLTPTFSGGTSQTGTSLTSSGNFAQYLTAGPGNNALLLSVSSVAQVVLDNISVREVLGVVAVQPTAGARGRWGSWPVIGRRNLLTFTEDFSSSAWQKISQGTGVAPVLTAGFADPNGGNTAWRLQINAGANGPSDFSLVRQASAAWPDQGVRSIWLRSNTGSDQTVTLVATSGANRVTVTSAWQRFEQTSAAGSKQLDISVGGPAATGATADILVWRPQFEQGTVATAYQRVGAEEDITETGQRNSGFFRFDLTDDAFTFTLPSAVDGELFVLGRSGSWREPRAASAGAAVTIGGAGAGTLATPGLLRATGRDVVAIGFRAGTMTADEWLRLRRWARSFGARGELIPTGPELVTNGTFNTNINGWSVSGEATISWQSGTLRVTNNTPFSSGSSPSAQQSIPTVVGAPYLANVTLAAATSSGMIGISTTSAGTSRELGERVFGGVVGTYRVVFVATAATTFIKLFTNSLVAGVQCDFDNISVRALTPEW